MTQTIIIAICSLLLIAYIFDLTASKTKVPSVILLLLLGWFVRQVTSFFYLELPDFTEVLPVLGTIGLILIVLEGSLEVEMNKSKLRLMSKSVFGALLSLVAMSFLMAFLFYYYGNFSFRLSLINAIPIAVISSAIAIPSVRNLDKKQREFIVYESSFSDIFGVLLFNFIALNEVYDFAAFSYFGLEVLIMGIVSFIATLGLAILLKRIEHHIKFVPIILLVILIYAIAKSFHLPSLIFILLFGLFIGNLDELKQFKWIKRLDPAELNKEVKRFKELTGEATFLVRALFFLLFGYLIETAEILNMETLMWSFGIVGIIFAIRVIQLKLSGMPLNPALFISPRGLITILLFLSIDQAQQIPIVNRSVIIQVIILTALIMMFGLMVARKNVDISETEKKKSH
ncbi:MAG: cation:proton antiporter [Crocinitomicaceae bacterium]|nr:cation:proton antiporter [Crocinitomicaceae bacterium]